jgi:hypothetical protein
VCRCRTGCGPCGWHPGCHSSPSPGRLACWSTSSAGSSAGSGRTPAGQRSTRWLQCSAWNWCPAAG